MRIALGITFVVWLASLCTLIASLFKCVDVLGYLTKKDEAVLQCFNMTRYYAPRCEGNGRSS